MPTKTDRILGYLPRTFQTSPRPPVLYPVVDTFGRELLVAENSLSAVMLSHWVDFADKGATAVDDLERIAALYGLAPRDDESVEEFREHLKHYVRTFLEGTVTVQGILRISAEVLGLHIADANADLDAWWQRPSRELVTVDGSGDDAAEKVFGFAAMKATGAPSLPAQLKGAVSLSSVTLPGPSILHLTVDGGSTVDVNLAGSKKSDDIIAAINTAIGKAIATVDGSFLVLTSATLGASSRLDVLTGPSDAAPQVLGLISRTYQGTDAVGAALTGSADLSAGVDLSHNRYLRLAVDGKHLAEVDCADPHTPTASHLDGIRDAINTAIGVANVAGHDGKHLILRSPSQGFQSSIMLQTATAQDAAILLFGAVAPLQTGRDAGPARAIGSRDLSSGIDLISASNIQLTIDGASRTVNCAGLNPAKTQTLEIVTAINAAFGNSVASPNGTSIAVASRTTGPAGSIIFGTPASGDATEAIFGISPRLFVGSDATAARIVGTQDLAPPPPAPAGVDLAAQDSLSLAIDGGPALNIDLRPQTDGVRSVTAAQLASAINQAASANIASTDGHHLVLISPTSNATSSLEIQPRERIVRRPFVTRALVIDEAAQLVFGTVSAQAQGTPGTTAEMVGTTDLSYGVDLRGASILRITIDDLAPQEINCTGARSRATLLKEIVDAINAKLPKVADTDNKHLILHSHSSGSKSRIVIEPPTLPDPTDALPLLGFPAATVRGGDATRVAFTSLVDLSSGIDLKANAAINLTVDGVQHEIALAASGPVHRDPGEIATLINVEFKASVCVVSGARLVLSSAKKGKQSQLGLNKPAGSDATALIFGVSPQRLYQGEDSQPARIESSAVDLSKPLDLSVGRFLRLAVNGGAAQDVDCALKAANPSAATLAEVVASIKSATPALPVVASASTDGKHLVLATAASGFASTLEVQTHPAGDASQKLLGTLDPAVQGQDPGPAVLTGTASVSGPVDLSKRNLVRLSVNGGRPVDIDVAGLFPNATSLSEVADAINRVFPNLAATTPDDKLQLTATAVSSGSSLAVLPLRYLELIDYPPQKVTNAPVSLAAGGKFSLTNNGAAESILGLRMKAITGVVDPTLVNLTSGRSISLHTALDGGDTACLNLLQDHGLRAEIISANGERRKLPADQIRAGALSSTVVVPFAGERKLTRDASDQWSLQLNNPSSPNTVVLRNRSELVGSAIVVKVQQSTPANSSLFDVELQVADTGGVTELYKGVTIGEGSGEGSLTQRINAGTPFGKFSQIVKAEELSKGDALTLPLGDSKWIYVECDGPRYDQTEFYDPASPGSADDDIKHRYPGKFCEQVGVFNLSRYAQHGSAREDSPSPYYGPPPATGPDVQLTADWMKYQPGSFAVNLPADLDERFGARFNQSYFATQKDPAELYSGVVAEPQSDTNNLVNRIKALPSAFVKAQIVDRIPLGWSGVKMPFRAPQQLTRNPGDDLARIYLTEEGLNGAIELTALKAGSWGDHISVSARPSGPAIYDAAILFLGARYENARQLVQGPLPSLGTDLVEPGPIGVLQAKAAGVFAQVTRDRTDHLPDSESSVKQVV
jgi:hypothetical protein